MEAVVRRAGLRTTDWASAWTAGRLSTEQWFQPCVVVVSVVGQGWSGGFQQSAEVSNLLQPALF